MLLERKTDIIALKKHMVEKDMNITRLSQKTGLSRSCLSSVIGGKSQPSADVMEKLIAALDIPLDEAGPIFFAPYLRTA